ncbi:cell envelope integrity protein CreD [Chitiniphilus shinanonensis]|uniref:cell envelope integrity protein CreD n=1 Tax=Chitiniphilus shinanonensis TaxID=553088 RepID=UPI00305058A0
MNRSLAWKLAALAFLVVVLLIPLSMVRGLVEERQQRAQQVEQEMAAYSARPQTLVGPLVVLPYRKTVWTLSEKQQDGHTVKEWRAASADESVVVLQPERLTLKAGLDSETLRRGIYESRLYHADARLSGGFRIPARAELEAPAGRGERVEYEWGRPFLTLGVSDARGIGALAGQLDEAPLQFLPGAGVNWLSAGLHAPLDLAVGGDARTSTFALQLKLAGTGELAVAPVGKAVNVTLSGNWPHPSFDGRFAPVRRQVTGQGFAAEWETSYWASGFTDEAVAACVKRGAECGLFGGEQLGLRLIDPVNRYLLAERTVKYAELFLLLIFGAVLVVEVVKRVAVHPVQYGLVGIALALFFLLTLSLAEHIAFAAAYWIAAGASTALLGFYGSHVLGGWRRGAGFAGLLAGLYGLLFGILQSEDMALLMGSLALFALLAVVMVLTRGVDWYALAPVRRGPTDLGPTDPVVPDEVPPEPKRD